MKNLYVIGEAESPVMTGVYVWRGTLSGTHAWYQCDSIRRIYYDEGQSRWLAYKDNSPEPPSIWAGPAESEIGRYVPLSNASGNMTIRVLGCIPGKILVQGSLSPDVSGEYTLTNFLTPIYQKGASDYPRIEYNNIDRGYLLIPTEGDGFWRKIGYRDDGPLGDYTEALGEGLSGTPSVKEGMFGQPVIECIAQKILSTLQGVLELNGYSVSLTAHRPTRIDWQDINPLDKRAILVAEENREYASPAVGCDDRVQTYGIYILSLPSESDPRAADAHANQIAASVHKAIMADWTCGGLAENVELIHDNRAEAREAEWPGVILKYDVHYRTKLGDPYSRV
ncbi:MAG TPA: hypothetical protein PKY88_12790 [Anaerohalosphaeraceae bacterium]|nr:hypothetical protein [Anaerohalosphaeraceae bacterium]